MILVIKNIANFAMEHKPKVHSLTSSQQHAKGMWELQDGTRMSLFSWAHDHSNFPNQQEKQINIICNQICA